MTDPRTAELTDTVARQAALARDGTAGDSTAIFLHIGKTAGTTLATILKQQYPANARLFVDSHDPASPIEQIARLGDQRVSRLRLIHGHLLYGSHAGIPGPALYFTLLRDPVKRLVSAYHHIVRTRSHYAHEQVAGGALSLAQFVSGAVTLETDNWQARAIAGDESTEFGACDETLLGAAKAVIEEHFSLVGLSERFDESVVVLGRMYGWRRVRYVKRNRGAGEAVRTELSAADRAAIDRHTGVERELYDHAGRLLDGVIEALGGIEPALATLRRTNAVYAPVGETIERLRIEARRRRR